MPEDKPPPAERQPFPIAALCASAGGLETLTEFLKHMPPDSGLAFVVVIHLDPSTESQMASLLQKATRMKVQAIEEGMAAQPNQVYVIPPGHELELTAGTFHLHDLPRSEVRTVIDNFLQSLAADRGQRAIGVILSGSGRDGSTGLKAIKVEGGLVIAQKPETAAYPGMPRSAVETGLADFILPVPDIPPKLVDYVEQSGLREPEPVHAQISIPDEALQKIFRLVRAYTKHDFNHYKASTIRRRTIRRMVVHHMDDVADYIHHLSQHPEEREALFQEFLISVTGFFRDAEAFAYLEAEILPGLLEGRAPDEPVRVWVPGCATGEETYSLAILLREAIGRQEERYHCQIFATDIDAAAIEQARRRQYPLSIAQDMSQERLDRFFTREDNIYRVTESIREMIVFAEHNLLSDPPFSNLDLISCRNLLIYLEPKLQRKALRLCHYALKPDGYLFLGSSETVGVLSDAFKPVHREWRIFQPVRDVNLPHPVDTDYSLPVSADQDFSPEEINRRTPEKDYEDIIKEQLLAYYNPTAALLTRNYNILYSCGEIDRYLKVRAGQFSWNILDMARPGLKLKLSTLLHQVEKKSEGLKSEGLTVQINGGGEQKIDLTLRPVPDTSLILAIFEPLPAEEEPPAPESRPAPPEGEERTQELEQELEETRRHLQNTIEDLQSVNEELKSANEELQTANEELQSTNEELKTAKEEEQSTNEELNTVNAELQSRNEELLNARNDLKNLLTVTQIAIIFLTEEMTIRDFTEEATELFNIIEADKGRPLEHVTTKLRYEGLVEEVRQVLRTLEPREIEVQTEGDAWHNMRIMPYRTLNNIIDGAVIVFEDITHQKEVEAELRRANKALEASKEYTEHIINTVPDGLLILSDEMRILSVNRSFCRMFEMNEAQATGSNLYELNRGEWDIPELRRLLSEVSQTDGSFKNEKISRDFPGLGHRTFRLNARRLRGERDTPQILLVIEDIGQDDQK